MNKLICRPRAPGGCKSPQLCGQPVTLLRGAHSGSRSSQRAGAGAGSRPAAPRRGTAGLSRSPPQDGAPAGRVSLPPGRGGLCLPQSPLCVWGGLLSASSHRSLQPRRGLTPLSRPFLLTAPRSSALRASSAHRLRPHSLARPAWEAPAALPVAAPQRGGRGCSL